MKPLYFPRKEQGPLQNNITFPSDKLERFRSSGEELEERAERADGQHPNR